MKASSQQERLSAQAVVARASRLSRRLQRVMPEATEDLISRMSVDLTDFWEIGEQHRKRLAAIDRLRSPRDRIKLATLLSELVYRNLYFHLPCHVRSMRRVLPGVIEKLESSTSKARKR